MTKRREATERFAAMIERGGSVPPGLSEPCHVWQGSKNNGYGRFRVDGRSISAHRWIFQQTCGPAADGFEIDHLCRNRACVNVAHLEAVTHRENIERSPLIVTMINREKTHCPSGHQYTEENTHRPATGGRRCRTCVRDETRLRARARRATGRR